MKNIRLGNKVLDFSRPLVMGILNVTPDSFYDGGVYNSEVKVTARIHQLMEEGADIIDVGAYSTRPGAAPVDEKEEIARLEPAVELIRKYYPEANISIDTFRSKVAEEINGCFGPVLVNDISGGTLDKHMFAYVTRTQVPYIMMHIQGTPQTMQKNPVYSDVVKEVRMFFEQRIKCLNEMGFDNIILDPGFGFGKTLEHNYQLLDALDEYADMGYPVLAGMSRKSMICRVLELKAADALTGTTVLNTIALLKGAHLLRVHDVKEAVETVKIVEMLKRQKCGNDINPIPDF